MVITEGNTGLVIIQADDDFLWHKRLRKNDIVNYYTELQSDFCFLEVYITIQYKPESEFVV